MTSAELTDRRNAHEDELLRTFKRLLPESIKQVVVLAGRGFGDVALYDMLKAELGFDYVIRFRKCIMVRDEAGTARHGGEWVPKNGHALLISNAKVTGQKYRVTAVVAVKRAEPGAATRPLPETYRRREPEKTLLHRLVREHLATFLAELNDHGRGLPRHVERALRSYLSCGLLSEGFLRVCCPACGEELLVAFSCKTRGFCPSCCARRMYETAAHLVDRVLPFVAWRQWVLSYPRWLRLLLARFARAARRRSS